MTTSCRIWWRNCAAEPDSEILAIDEMEDRITPLAPRISKIRELISSLELCHHNAERWVHNIIEGQSTVPTDTVKRKRESFELMKNQYFGDVNDYRKYGLLRALTGMGEVSTAVCWMLTPHDGSTDGKFVQYLRDPMRWRHLDPELFDELREAVIVGGERGVVAAEESNLLPASRFFNDVLPDDPEGRRTYFESFWTTAAGCDLIFFDPDNGMEVRSKPEGHKGSSKYLYWSELADAFFRGKSVLVYQHFRRSRRDFFISEMAQNSADRMGTRTVYSFRTPSVVYFLLLQGSLSTIIERNIPSVVRTWHGQISIQKHLFSERAGQLL